jgi:hypothetical protein
MTHDDAGKFAQRREGDARTLGKCIRHTLELETARERCKRDMIGLDEGGTMSPHLHGAPLKKRAPGSG